MRRETAISVHKLISLLPSHAPSKDLKQNKTLHLTVVTLSYVILKGPIL